MTESEATAAAMLATPETQQTMVLEVTPLATAVTAQDAAAPTLAPEVNAQAPAFGKQPPPQPGQTEPLTVTGAEPSGRQVESDTWRAAWIVLIGVQVLLAILAIVTGAAAIYLRRQARH